MRRIVFILLGVMFPISAVGQGVIGMPTIVPYGLTPSNNPLCYPTMGQPITNVNCASSGGGGTTTNALTISNSGGVAAGTTFNGSSAVTISYTTVGADASGAAAAAQAASLQKSNNLSDLANAATARTNLGLGTAATTNATAYDAVGSAAAAQSAAETASDPAGSASTAQTNAEAYASNASNISSGTLSSARLPATITSSTSGTAANVTAATNSTLTTLSSLSLPYSQVTGTPANVADVQITVATTQVPANSCLPSATTYYSVIMLNLISTMTATFTPSANYSSVTGWSAAGGTLYFNAYPTGGALQYQVCNNTSSAITPSSSTVWNVGAR